MRIEAGVLEKCPTDAITAEIPENVKFIADNAFAGCAELKQIISKSPLFVSKSGCLYDAKNKILITTVCGSVVIPREVRGALEGSLTNCTSVSFESGGEFVDIKCNPQDTGGSDEIIELITKEADKNYAKLIKQAKMNEISAAAVLKQILSKSGMDIQQYRVGDCISALSLPADIGGVDIMLADADFQTWMTFLPELLSKVKNGIAIAELVACCREHNIILPSFHSKHYAVFDEKTGGVLGMGVETIKSVWISKGLDQIRSQVFTMCNSLEYLFFEGTKSQYEQRQNITANIIRSSPIRFVKCSDGDVEIVQFVIENDCFVTCNLFAESVTIPDGVHIIGENAFGGCDRLVSIYIPESVTDIRADAFSDCESLKNITFGGTKAQWESVTNNTRSLTVHTEAETVHCSDGETVIPPMLIIKNVLFYCRQNAETVVIPDGVEQIHVNALRMCRCRSIKMPSSLIRIDDAAITECDCLESVEIPGSVEEIDGLQFVACGSLTNITFGGTLSRWKAINKYPDWQKHLNRGAVIHCTDGEIEI